MLLNGNEYGRGLASHQRLNAAELEDGEHSGAKGASDSGGPPPRQCPQIGNNMGARGENTGRAIGQEWEVIKAPPWKKRDGAKRRG